MSGCDNCELFKDETCPGTGGGGYCTEIIDYDLVAKYHPANVDPQGPISCEIAFFYESPALQEERDNQEAKGNT